ncbi:MAG: DUF4174 domain-containing protein [Acidobacteriota bacterium]
MTRSVLALVLLLGALAPRANAEIPPSNAAVPEHVSLLDLRWDHRLIVVFADRARAVEVMDTLADAADGMEERGIRWFVVDRWGICRSNGVACLHPTDLRFLRKPDRLASDAEAVVVGKDGLILRRFAEFDLREIVELIDAQPDRQDEIAEQEAEAARRR